MPGSAKAGKRPPADVRVTLAEGLGVTQPHDVDLLLLDGALTELSALDSRARPGLELSLFRWTLRAQSRRRPRNLPRDGHSRVADCPHVAGPRITRGAAARRTPLSSGAKFLRNRPLRVGERQSSRSTLPAVAAANTNEVLIERIFVSNCRRLSHLHGVLQLVREQRDQRVRVAARRYEDSEVALATSNHDLRHEIAANSGPRGELGLDIDDDV